MVKQLYDYMLLFHGSYCEVKQPDLRFCKQDKDFGKGFYLTSDREQAESFSRISTNKAINNGMVKDAQSYGVVSTYIFHAKTALDILMFYDADIEWLDCIAAHRAEKKPDSIDRFLQYDIIGGKVANDQTNTTLLAYISGLYGPVGSREAAEICIGLLLPERLKDQYCFRNKKALSCVEFVESEKIWIK